tara:strand:- start:257 stop:1261 length:1005 start_codon:yes stop_codon:yes gene_type:complete
MSHVSLAGSKRAREEEDDDSDDEEEAAQAQEEAVERLTSVPLKIAGALYAAAGGKPMVGIAREDLLAPLEALGVDNPSNATQQNRLKNYAVAHWFLHNQERGADARISLTREGIDALREVFTNDEDEVEQDALDALCAAMRGGGTPQDAAETTPLSQRKPSRLGGGTPAAAAAEEAEEALVEAEAEAEDEAEDEDEAGAEDEDEAEVAETEEEDTDYDDVDVDLDALVALQNRIDCLQKRFDDGVNVVTLAAAYGDSASGFLQAQGRVPTSREGDRLLREARRAMYGDMEIGDGAVKHDEIRAMFLKLEAAVKLATKLAFEVRALEERATTTAK